MTAADARIVGVAVGRGARDLAASLLVTGFLVAFALAVAVNAVLGDD